MTAILVGDMDVALSLRSSRVRRGPPHPRRRGTTNAIPVIGCHGRRELEQAFRAWVMEKARFVELSLSAYRQASGRVFDFQQLRSKILDRPDCIEPTFLFSYCVARLRRLDSIMPGGRDSDFGSQLRLNILFYYLVTDDVLRRVAPGKWEFISTSRRSLASAVPLSLKEDGSPGCERRLRA